MSRWKEEKEMETLNTVLSGLLMPALLIGAGLFFGVKLRFFWIRHPCKVMRTLREASAGSGTSPAAALSMALAGTLGVGNIAGVATAITAGGAGAVFWMLLGALAAMSVKYAEVYLAVRYRRIRQQNGAVSFYGGAMYYIRDGIAGAAKSKAGKKAAAALGGFFALLCAANALLTGNIVQVRAAVSCIDIPPLLFGVLFAVLAIAAASGGAKRVSSITAVLIPALSAVYILLSLWIISCNWTEIVPIFAKIWEQAWEWRPVGGGFLGLAVSRAVRFGITRGIFSNEAGCGTAPTAHASADTQSPYHQGCFGIFEVFADTVILCTITALVILLYADGEGLDGIELSLTAYTRLGSAIGGPWLGNFVNIFMRLSVVLFAFATVVCQSYYGVEAIRYFVSDRRAKAAYLALSAAAIILGSLIQPSFMWSCADFIISLMTSLNVVCLLLLSNQVKNR